MYSGTWKSTVYPSCLIQGTISIDTHVQTLQWTYEGLLSSIDPFEIAFDPQNLSLQQEITLSQHLHLVITQYDDTIISGVYHRTAVKGHYMSWADSGIFAVGVNEDDVDDMRLEAASCVLL